jgi:hypothetical protein
VTNRTKWIVLVGYMAAVAIGLVAGIFAESAPCAATPVQHETKEK